MSNAETRVFLFLQGPASPFLDRVARELIVRGHEALRINISFGDQIFWKLPGAVAYRGRLENWRAFVSDFYDTRGVTDIMLLGDCRPHHAVAIAEAHARNIRVHVTELGYIRPDWLTLERDGMTSFSHFPRDAARIRAMAETAPKPSFKVLYPSRFATLAAWDVAYNLSNVFLSPFFYPHYHWHAIHHPLAEYAGWLGKFIRSPLSRKRLRRQLDAIENWTDPYFVFPLQLATDYQIRKHSPFDSLQEAMERVIRSFARKAPKEARLVLKVHPLDNELVDWSRVATELATECGCADRVVTISGGDVGQLIKKSAGVVTINSTVGTSTLQIGRPLIALGNAIFDIEGLTFQGPLDDFWTGAKEPEADLVEAFIRVLAATIQVRGGYYSRAGIAAGARAAAERVLSDGEVLPRIAPQDRDVVYYRRAAE